MVKLGYKQTEIGMIPEEWSLLSVNELIEVLTDFTANGSFESLAENVTYLDNPDYARLVRLTDIRSNFKNKGIYVSKYSYDFLRKSSLQGGELLLANVGAYAGYSFLFEKNFSEHATLGPNMFLIKANKDIVLPQYMPFIFGYGTVFKQLMDAAASSAQPKINKDNVRKCLAIIPPIYVQERIAQVFSDVDGMISTLEKLVAKKKAIKQGAMQELLTGKKRLPGFPGEWKSDMLPNILQKDMGIKIGPFGSQLRKEYLLEDGPYRVYGQENVYEHDFTIGTRYLSKERFQQLQSCEICPGDFLISTMGTIGKCAIAPEGLHKGIMDSHLIRLRIDKQKILPEYLLHLFSEELGYLKNQTSKLSVGGIMDGLSTKIVNSLTVYFPVNLVEQQAIAKVLTDLDTEVKALEQKLGKYRQVKQGMMQQLLTGKIRLV